MLNKEKLKKAYFDGCKKAQIDVKNVVLGAGGVCVMLGLRSHTNDVDVDVEKKIFDILLQCNYKNHALGNNLVLEVTEYMDVHLVDKIKDTIVIEGVTCYTAESVLRFKLNLNREKDQADIRALREYLKNNPNGPV